MRNNLEISIHAPVKGATFIYLLPPFRNAISIHAPVKGATFFTNRRQPLIQISIHAPVKGATSDFFKDW